MINKNKIARTETMPRERNSQAGAKMALARRHSAKKKHVNKLIKEVALIDAFRNIYHDFYGRTFFITRTFGILMFQIFMINMECNKYEFYVLFIEIFCL